MTSTQLRALAERDGPAIFDLALQMSLAELHPQDRISADASFVSRRIRRGLRRDVVANLGSLGAFERGTVRAFALFGDGKRPVTGEPERHLLDLMIGPHDLALLPGLIHKLVKDARSAGITMLRATTGVWSPVASQIETALRAVGFRTYHLIVRRAIAAREPLAGAGYAPTRQDQRQFALECLAQAVRNGLGGGDLKGAAAYVAKHYRQLHTSGRLSMVATGDEGAPRAHALVELVPAKCRPGREAMLIDIFVPSQWHGQGWSALLWSYVESELAARGLDRAEGTVGWMSTNDPETVVSRLRRDGWWVDRTLLELPL